MKQIDPKELGLSIKSYLGKPANNEWLFEHIRTLIKKRIQHCRVQLDAAMQKGEAFLANGTDSQYIIYIKNGKVYGHFSIPTYNCMIEYIENNIPINKGIVQQALRQYLENLRFDITRSNTDLEEALTEMMLVL